jgi:hypothetical protein
MDSLASSVRRWSALGLVLLTSGCASVSGWETESAPADFPDGLRVLGEVILVTSREEALAGQGLMKGWRDKLIAAGYTAGDIVDGSELTVWAYCYGYNSGVPVCAHHGHYVAHVPRSQHDEPQGNPPHNPASGDLVEIELVRTSSGALVGTLVAVYRKSGEWSPCREAFLERDSASTAILSVSGVGPPRANWIECDSAVEADGWVRRPIAGAPTSTGRPVSVWVKFPEQGGSGPARSVQ